MFPVLFRLGLVQPLHHGCRELPPGGKRYEIVNFYSCRKEETRDSTLSVVAVVLNVVKLCHGADTSFPNLS